MSINFAAISACTAVVAACITILGLWIQERRYRFLHGIDVLFRLSDEFGTETFRCTAAELARLVIQRSVTAWNDLQLQRFHTLATEFLNHFETLGFLARKRILDKEFIYVYYFYRFHGFWRVLQEEIAANRPAYPELWTDAEWLHGELLAIAKKQQPKAYLELSDAYVMQFMEHMAQEQALVH